MGAVKDRGYPYIQAWGKMLGSDPSYIREETQRAIADKAPPNATHRAGDGTWSTTDDVISNQTRQLLGLDPLPPTAPAILVTYDGHIITEQRAAGLDNFLYRIRFPSLQAAVMWAVHHKITDQVNVVGSDENHRIDQPCTVEYLRDE